jgi:plasmid replication initiation protein
MKDNIIVKKNDFLRFGYTLSLMEQRLLLACIAKVDSRKSLDMNKQFEISVQEIKDLFAPDSQKHLYRDLKEACDRLFERRIVVRTGNKTTKLRWVWKIEYQDNSAIIQINFSPDVIPYLSAISERFTKYKLRDVKDFKCVHSLRLYELFAQFQSTGSRELSVDELRQLLDLKDKYLIFSELKRSVIDKSIKEINEYSNLLVSYGERKRGRKVIGLQFYFKTKTKTIQPESEIEPLVHDKNERQLLIEQLANSRKRFGNAVNESNVPLDIVKILKEQGRW